ncbi:hypothetical protein Pyrde_1247 [Pyrodictium delaneyi]|uniref:Uncharacterized protein n=1 Tax=Pyrodictium delaneyi TaxID=1273541 RepID=A0A0P0N4E8_9CREN|nr:hypothetical protein [Pyrodictium delaneyi]ALL01295.1 hypothetical protein Pyrde_1247 [Pyrodictium delaneyi]
MTIGGTATEKNTNIERRLTNLVRDRTALRALLHAVSRVEELNHSEFPVAVEAVGLTGSALRIEDAGDIDVVLACRHREERMKEWWEFDQILRKSVLMLLEMAYELSYETGRATMEALTRIYRAELLELGFKEKWLNNWLPFLTISWLRYVARLPAVPRLRPVGLLDRFVRKGWSGKRLEIHVDPLDEGCRSSRLATGVPYIVLWKRGQGFVEPSREELDRFLRAEHQKLKHLVKALIERDVSTLPTAYMDILGALEAEEPVCPPFTPQEWCTATARLYSEAKRLLIQRYNYLVELANTEHCDTRELSELNRKLSATLKELEALSYIVNTLSNSRALDKIVENIIYGAKSKASFGSFLQELKNYLIRNGSRIGVRRKHLHKLLEDLTSKATTITSPGR